MIKKCVLFLKTSFENQHIFFVTCKELGMSGWGLANPYDVRILNLLRIIGRTLRAIPNLALSLYNLTKGVHGVHRVYGVKSNSSKKYIPE